MDIEVQFLLSSRLISKNAKIKIYLLFLYGCESWSFRLKEEHRMRVCENRMFRGIFGLKTDEMRGGWRKLHNEEPHSLYSSNIDQINEGKMDGEYSAHGEMRNDSKIMVGKSEGKRPLGRPRRG
jgi:hypothetical protein